MSGYERAPLTPDAVGELFRCFPHSWWIAGGWAIDLFLGHTTREHGDIEVALLRRDQQSLRRHLPGWELRYAADGGLHAWPEEEWLELPRHEIWARTHDDPRWRLELLLNESSGGEWLFRRDPRLSRPLDEVGVTTAAGLSILAPEIVLLYKARLPEPKDEADLAAVLSALDDGRRSWLASALGLVHPGHRWVDSLNASRSAGAADAGTCARRSGSGGG